MSAAQLDQVGAALAAFSSITRLYELKLEDDATQGAGALLVEAFAGDEQLQTLGARDVIVLAQRYAQLQMQAHEARAQLWQARSTVRTLRAGTRFTLTQGPLQPADGAAPEYVVLRVASIGVNNLPAPALEGLAELFGPIPALLEETVAEWGAGFPDFAAAIAQAQASGYANCIEMISASTPWRPVHDDNDARQHATPTALGSQSAIVVGADGNDVASGADDIYCDKLGRVRIRFHWQQEQHAGCWVRVAQRAAGGGMGNWRMANGETVSLMSGLDTQFAGGGQWRLHTGQAIGMLGGVVKPGEAGLGLQLVAASQPIEVQAQSDEIRGGRRARKSTSSAPTRISTGPPRRASACRRRAAPTSLSRAAIS